MTIIYIPPSSDESVEGAIPTPNGSVLIINRYCLQEFEVIFGLYKLGSMLFGHRDVARGQQSYFAEGSVMNFGILLTETQLKPGDFIEDLSVFDEHWSVDLNDFPNGVRVTFIRDDAGKFSLITKQKYA